VHKALIYALEIYVIKNGVSAPKASLSAVSAFFSILETYEREIPR
jgi:hypothetical protein